MRKLTQQQCFLVAIFLFSVASLHAQKIIKVTPHYVLIDTADGIGQLNETVLIKRNVDQKIIAIGTIKLVKFHNGKTVAKIIQELEPYHVEIGDFVKSQTGNENLIDNFTQKQSINNGFGQEKYTNEKSEPKFGIGYEAAMFGLWIIDLNMRWNMNNILSTEVKLGIGMDGPSYENGRGYEGIGIKMIYEFTKTPRINFYGSAKIWYLIGSQETLDLLAPKGEKYLGIGVNIGSEVWNGYFCEFGFIKIDYISSFSIMVGKHYYF